MSVAASDDVLWYSSPATEWTDALPLGNGRMGAMVFGAVPTETIQLNEESLWAGRPFDSYPDDFLLHLNKVRKLVSEGRIAEAHDYGQAHLVKEPTSFRSYEPLADLIIDLDHDGPVEDYRRQLDMEAGIITVSYRVGQVRYVRETLISAVDDVLVVRLTSSAPKGISATVSLRRQKDMSVRAVGNDLLHMDGQIVDDDSPGAYEDNPGGSGPGGKHMRFAGRLYVDVSFGDVNAEDGSIRVSDAASVSLIFSAATDYNLEKLSFDRSIDPGKLADSLVEEARARSVDNIRSRHLSEHRKMYNRVSIDLGGTERLAIPTDERLELVKDGGQDSALSAQLFQFGRYLLMSSSRKPGRLPANLQGIWNKDMWAPWEADYHMNINLQMNYWPTDVTNLSETIEPFAGWFEGVAKKGEVTATTLYNARGWLMYTMSNPFGKTSPGGSDTWSQFVNGVLDPLPGAWMAQALWRHYEFKSDEQFLAQRAYPVLKGASEFMLDTLVENENGDLVISPSSSPENSFIDPRTKEPYRVTQGSTYHNVLVRETLATTLRSAETLAVDEEFQRELSAVLERIPPTEIGADGTIMEWAEDYAEAEPDHRHLSHLLGFHPFAQITEDDKALYDAARRTVEKRIEAGGGQNGWGRAWMISFFARLSDGNSAHHHLNEFMRENLFASLLGFFAPVEGGPAVYQIEGNFATTASVAEMLLQSHAFESGKGYEVNLLPALPDAWSDGSVRGLRARGGHTVNLSWEDGQLHDAVIHAGEDGVIPVRYGDKSILLQTEGGRTYRLNAELERL